MGMSHKAFAFDWSAFERELLPILVAALGADDRTPLLAFIDAHRDRLTDPYEGDPLPTDWRSLLTAGDAQEAADFALTRYYHPGEDYGIGHPWMRLSDEVAPKVAAALLGHPVGPPGRLFDPGRYGSYFQRPEQVPGSLLLVAGARRAELSSYRELLEECLERRMGVYVTF
jgi:hypothetical protein